MGESEPQRAESGRDFADHLPLAKDRLDRLVRQIARLYRRGHLTAQEVRYVHKRARTLATYVGGPNGPRSCRRS